MCIHIHVYIHTDIQNHICPKVAAFFLPFDTKGRDLSDADGGKVRQARESERWREKYIERGQYLREISI
jgi:hypothetical protein